jgi:hypothetical protein
MAIVAGMKRNLDHAHVHWDDLTGSRRLHSRGPCGRV